MFFWFNIGLPQKNGGSPMLKIGSPMVKNFVLIFLGGALCFFFPWGSCQRFLSVFADCSATCCCLAHGASWKWGLVNYKEEDNKKMYFLLYGDSECFAQTDNQIIQDQRSLFALQLEMILIKDSLILQMSLKNQVY